MSCTVQLRIKGMDCPDEIEDLRRAFARQTGIIDLSFNLIRSTMTVALDPSAVGLESILSVVEATSMHAVPVRDGALPLQEADRGRRSVFGMTVVAGTSTAVGFVLAWVPATSERSLEGTGQF